MLSLKLYITAIKSKLSICLSIYLSGYYVAENMICFPPKGSNFLEE